MELTGISQGASKRPFKFLLRSNAGADSPSYHVADPFILPLVNIIERSFKDLALGGISAIVEDDDDRDLPVADRGGQFRAGHLKRAVAHQDNGPHGGVGE